jgi:hypothetical protein
MAEKDLPLVKHLGDKSGIEQPLSPISRYFETTRDPEILTHLECSFYLFNFKFLTEL